MILGALPPVCLSREADTGQGSEKAETTMQFPDALFSTVDTAIGGFGRLKAMCDVKNGGPTPRLHGVLHATAPDGRKGFVIDAEYPGLFRAVYGPGECGDSRTNLERNGWNFEQA